jgi:hypothetical protein
MVQKNGMQVTRDGVVPFLNYTVIEKGKVVLASFSCAMCHTRVMPDGSSSKAHREKHAGAPARSRTRFL